MCIMTTWTLFWLVILSTTSTSVEGLFGPLPVYYRLHGNNKTWNEARTICDLIESRLLGINSVEEWKSWKDILYLTQYTHGRASKSGYWFGLHSPVQGRPGWLAWDETMVGGSCKVAEYTGPLNPLNTTGLNSTKSDEDIENSTSSSANDAPIGTCGSMWVNEEVQTGIEVDGRWSKEMCSNLKPFICESVPINGSGCMPECDELLVMMAADLCPMLCLPNICLASYIHESGLCHVTPMLSSEYIHPSHATICYFPSLDSSPNVCAESFETIDYDAIHDDNADITDTNCQASFSSITMETKNNYTASSNNETVEQGGCTCLCQQLWTFLATPPPAVINLTTEEKVEIIVKNLTIDKKNTTVSIRQYVSVMDHRVSSYGIGIVAGVIIFSIIGVIVLMDLVKFWEPILRFMRTYFAWLKGFRIRPIRTLVEATKSIAVPIATSPDGENGKNGAGSTDKVAKTSISEKYKFDRWFQRELVMLKPTKPPPSGEVPKPVDWMKKEGLLTVPVEKYGYRGFKESAKSKTSKSVGWMEREGQLSMPTEKNDPQSFQVVGWLLRENAVYDNVAPPNTRLEMFAAKRMKDN